MFNRIISLALCLFILIISLCSCADDEPQSKDNNTSGVTSSSANSEQKESSADVSSEETQSITPDKLSAMNEWQRAYVDYIEINKDEYSLYALVFIDDDDVPELYMSGLNEATGDGVYSLKHGAIVEQKLGLIGGGSYIYKGGTFANQNGNMGVYYTDVYKLTADGFKKTFSAYKCEKIETSENGDSTLSYEYFVEGKRVDAKNYEDAVSASFNYEKSTSLIKNAVSYEEILTQIEEYK